MCLLKFANLAYFLYFCTFLIILNLYHHGKIQQTTLQLSAQQLTLNFYGFAFVFIQQPMPQPQPSDTLPISPESDSDSPSPAPDVKTEKKLFPCITKAAYDAGKAEEVDDELRSASVSAPKLVKALNINEALGYVDIKNMNSKDLYDLLDECYELKFGPRCFRNYRSK